LEVTKVTDDVLLEVLKDPDNAIIGVSIQAKFPDESIDDDIRNFANGVADGTGDIKVINSRITLLNYSGDNLVFELRKKEAQIIKKYLDGIATSETLPRIKVVKKWTLQVFFIFKNEQVRQESLQDSPEST
jgi:hypothetical protein